jgi:hypothetical protein
LETVTIVDVNKNERNWYEVELEDGRVAATKDKKVADAAYEAVGTPILADINVKQNGDFTNIYLNGIGEGTTVTRKVAKGKAEAPAPATATGAEKPSTRDADRQAAIQSQWAFGEGASVVLGSVAPNGAAPSP